MENEENWFECTRYNTYKVESPITQVDNYKNMLQSWYIPELAQKCILILSPSPVPYENFNDELVYTGITRARVNLIVVSIGKNDYDDFFTQYINEISK